MIFFVCGSGLSSVSVPDSELDPDLDPGRVVLVEFSIPSQKIKKCNYLYLEMLRNFQLEIYLFQPGSEVQ
jgi:hypothetical protein